MKKYIKIISLILVLCLFSSMDVFAQDFLDNRVVDNAQVFSDTIDYSIEVQTLSLDVTQALTSSTETTNLGLKLNQELQDTTAPDSVRYDLNLPSGYYLEEFLTPNHERDGSIGIYNASGELIDGLIVFPVMDAQNKEVPYEYEISNQTITVYINHRANQVVYPVTAQVQTTSAIDYKYFYNTVNFIRDSVDYYMVVRRNMDNWRAGESATWAILLGQAWVYLKEEWQGNTSWYNESSLYNQFMCHGNFAQTKNPWNLEPWRCDVGYAATCTALCNPSNICLP